MSGGPLIISREGLQLLAEGVIEAANQPERTRVVDAFLELKECRWCHGRFGRENLKDGICPKCRLQLHASKSVSEYLRKMRAQQAESQGE